MSLALIFGLIVVIGLLTYSLRASFLVGMSGGSASPRLQRVLRFVPVAVLPALVAPALLYRDGALLLSLDNTRLIAGLIAIAVAWFSRNVLATIAVGMLALWVLS